MARIPNQTVVAKIKFAMQRQAKFNDTQVGRKVGGASRQQVAQDIPDLRGDRFELIGRKISEGIRTVEAG